MELPRLEEIWKKFEGEGLSVVAIQSDQDREKGLSLVEEKGLTFHILHNEVENDVVNGVLRNEGNPSTFIIDREGRVVSYHLGFQEGDEVQLEKEMSDLISSPDGCG